MINAGDRYRVILKLKQDIADLKQAESFFLGKVTDNGASMKQYQDAKKATKIKVDALAELLGRV